MQSRLFFIAIPTIALALWITTGTAAGQHDITPPTLVDVQFEPESIAPGDSIMITAHVTDDVTGVSHVELYFRNMDAGQTVLAEFWIPKDGIRDGKFSEAIRLPSNAAAGMWELYHVILLDDAGNHIELRRSDDSEPNGGWPREFDDIGFEVTAGARPRLLYLPALLH